MNERDTLNNRACQLALEGNYDEAIKIFNNLIATDPNDLRSLSNLATTIGKSGRYQESLDLFDKLVSRAPDILSNRICYINLLTYMGKHKRARECYREMPRPGAIESMMLGSLSEDFKRKLQPVKRPKNDSERSGNGNPSASEDEKPAETTPRFISLIWAGPPRI